MSRLEKTTRKYADFLKDCHAQRTFSVRMMMEKHRVDASLISTMRDQGFITSVSSDVMNVIPSVLTADMISKIITAHRERIRMYNEKAKEKRKAEKSMLQHTIEPTELPITLHMTEAQMIDHLKSRGYEIFRVERRQL